MLVLIAVITVKGCAMMESSESEYQGDCPKHGPFVGKEVYFHAFGNRIRMICPACQIDRNAEEAEKEERKRQDQLARIQAERAEARILSGIPKRFDQKTLDGYQAANEGQVKALAACRSLVESVRSGGGANLILSGKPGTGKSHLSCGIVDELFATHRVRRIDWPDLIRKIRATWARDADYTEEQVLDHYGSLDLLILEEVGTGTGSDDEKARVFQVINRRYEAMLPTVIVTNLSVKELSAELGDRVIDRLREGDRALLVFDWESHRG